MNDFLKFALNEQEGANADPRDALFQYPAPPSSGEANAPVSAIEPDEEQGKQLENKKKNNALVPLAGS